MDLTHGRVMPVAEMMLEHLASNRGPIRKQHDFFYINGIMVMSSNISSASQAVNILWRLESDNDNSKLSSAYKITKL